MVDPRKKDPRFSDRPTHPDFIALSEVVQAHDALAEQLHMRTFEILGVDEKSFMYFMHHRFGVFAERAGSSGLLLTRTQAQALYLDAFALGKAYAENKSKEDTDDDND